MPPTKRRVPLGKPLPPVDGDIPAPSQQELDLVIADWDTFAPAKYRGMLTARPVGTDDPKARWFYDEAKRRYVSRAGHVVSPLELRAAFLAYQKARQKR